MKLATFTKNNRTRVGVVEGEEIIEPLSTDPMLSDMVSLLEAGAAGLQAIRKAANASQRRYALTEVHLEAPVMKPRKFMNLGGSYRSHIAEVAHLGIKPPVHQIWMNKQVTCVNGPFDPIHYPPFSDSMDYEGELAFVIGRRCRNVPETPASDAIAGFLICNDVSVREWQLRSPTATLGKSFDTHGPIGPWLVTFDELGGEDLSIKTWVNGELRQNGRTSELMYSFGEMLSELSRVFTLEPGDIIATGSPAGVGGAMQPPRYLKVGDVCRVEIEGIGHIENRVVAEPPGYTAPKRSNP